MSFAGALSGPFPAPIPGPAPFGPLSGPFRASSSVPSGPLGESIR